MSGLGYTPSEINLNSSDEEARMPANKPKPSNAKLEVVLTVAEKTQLESLIRKGNTPAAQLRHARILLLADADRRGEARNPDWYIAQVVGLSERQVVRIRRRFCKEGLSSCLNRKQRTTPPNPPKFDGVAEAKLITLCCSAPPAGRQRWTLQLLVDELCRLQVVASVCPETVRKTLKKIASNRGKPNASVSPNETALDSWPIWRKS